MWRGRLVRGRHGVGSSPTWIEGEDSGEGESSLKMGGIGMGGGVGLGSDGGYTGGSVLSVTASIGTAMVIVVGVNLAGDRRGASTWSVSSGWGLVGGYRARAIVAYSCASFCSS